MNDLTQKDLNWFRMANANPAPGFYEFKARFLKRFAVPDGFDLQMVPRICHACDGSGRYYATEDCNRCGGSGIYDEREYWLQRWSLRGQIYHKPVDHAFVWHFHNHRYPEPKSEIDGRIKHDDVSAVAALRAYRRLLLRHEPANYARHILDLIKTSQQSFKTKWHFRLIRLRNKLDLFPAVLENEVPF